MDYTKLSNEKLITLLQNTNSVCSKNALFERLFIYSENYIYKKYYYINDTDKQDIISESLLKFFKTINR